MVRASPPGHHDVRPASKDMRLCDDGNKGVDRTHRLQDKPARPSGDARAERQRWRTEEHALIARSHSNTHHGCAPGFSRSPKSSTTTTPGSPSCYEVFGGAISHTHRLTPSPLTSANFAYHWVDDHMRMTANNLMQCVAVELRQAMITLFDASAVNDAKFTDWHHQFKILGLIFDTLELREGSLFQRKRSSMHEYWSQLHTMRPRGPVLKYNSGRNPPRYSVTSVGPLDTRLPFTIHKYASKGLLDPPEVRRAPITLALLRRIVPN